MFFKWVYVNNVLFWNKRLYVEEVTAVAGEYLAYHSADLSTWSPALSITAIDIDGYLALSDEQVLIIEPVPVFPSKFNGMKAHNFLNNTVYYAVVTGRVIIE